MEEENIKPTCPNCGTELVEKEGKTYLVCPNWKPHGAGCEGTIYWPEGYRQNNYPMKLFSYKAKSRSNPGHYHIVVVYEDGSVDCPCPAGQMGKFCSHEKEMVMVVGSLMSDIKNNIFSK